MKRYIKDSTDNFTTFSVSTADVITASHMIVGRKNERAIIANELFEFIDHVYDEAGLGGFKSFKDIEHFINDSYFWYITYDGPQPNSLDDFDVSKVYVVSVYRNKFGLKMVGMARRIVGRASSSDKEANKKLRQKANSALVSHINFVKDHGWGEVSDKLEDWFHAVLGNKYIIDPYDLKDNKVFNDISIDIDEFHYYRPLRKGDESMRKIAYGTIKL